MAERPGLVGEADGSSLFLDEFAELPLEAQAHLLRVLDQGEYHRLGESKARRADLRLIAATNRPESAIKHDVLARMPLRLELPPLTSRPEDVPLLLRHLLRRITAQDPALARQLLDERGEARISPDLVAGLVRWPWTTHVRELEQLLWRSIGAAVHGLLEWPAELSTPAPEPASAESGAGVDPDSLDPAKVQEVLDSFDGQQEPTWRALGLSSRHVLTRLVRKHGLKVRGRKGPR
jgi:DNA-binding NtrC family response regulator